jgi:ribose/xylose/arabinose/galactoside ABC-type transport system permease subunit
LAKKANDEALSKAESIRPLARRLIRHENAVLLIVMFVLIGVMGGVTKGLTLGRANMSNILLQSSIRGVASVGQAFVILSANIDISIGGVGLFCSMLGASLMTSASYNIIGHPVSMYIVIPLMMLVGAGWGAINGSLVRIGVPSLIVTLGMWEVTQGFAYQVGKGESIGYLPERLNQILGAGNVLGVPVPVIVFIVVAVLGYIVLNYTTFGRCVYAVGGNPASAWISGINVKQKLLQIFIISGFLSGLAGAVFTARVMSASMNSLAGLELDTIASVAVGGISLAGGRGSLIGVIIGVIIIGIINNAMSILGAGPNVEGVVKGFIIIAAVTVDYLRRSRS